MNRTSTNKKAVATWVIKLAVLLGATISIFVAHQIASAYQQRITQQRMALEQRLTASLNAVETRSTLTRYAADLDQITSTVVPSHDELGSVITTIELEGAKHGVTVSVPTIVEDPAPSKGPIKDIRLRIIADGTPTNLLRFLYNLEHLPHTLYPISWNLNANVAQGKLRGDILVPVNKNDGAQSAQ